MFWIDACVQVTAERSKNHDTLEEVWENAVKLAMNHVPDRIHDVVNDVSQRLIDIKRYAQAAEMFEGIDKHTDAIRVRREGREERKGEASGGCEERGMEGVGGRKGG